MFARLARGLPTAEFVERVQRLLTPAGPLFDNKLVAFLGYVSTQLPDARFLVYSRRSWEDASVAANWRKEAGERFPTLVGKIETWRVPLDRATFRNPLTAQELKDSVVRLLGLPAKE